MSSDFYKDSIGGTYGDFHHARAGIPPYELDMSPKPVDLELGSLDEDDYHRMIVAYGLSIPSWKTEIKLPSEIPDAEPRRHAKRVGFSYEDTKDMFD